MSQFWSVCSSARTCGRSHDSRVITWTFMSGIFPKVWPNSSSKRFFSQKYLSFVEDQLNQNDVDFEVMIEDLGDAVNESLKTMNTEYAGLDDFNYENYSTWEVYQQWQDDFVAANSDLVSKTAYGQSYEKRELNYMKLGKGNFIFLLSNSPPYLRLEKNRSSRRYPCTWMDFTNHNDQFCQAVGWWVQSW